LAIHDDTISLRGASVDLASHLSSMVAVKG
jgi:hypothetical protein